MRFRMEKHNDDWQDEPGGWTDPDFAEAVLTSTHNLCFGAKIRKIGIPLHTPVLLYKSGIQGVHITRTCFPDDKM